MEQNSPLSLVRHAFDVYTDEQIATPEAVADMAAGALATMGEPGVTLAERIVVGLDPESTMPFGAHAALNLLHLADRALERGAPKDIRLGVVSMLGVLSLAYDTQSVDGVGAVGAAAREALWKLHNKATKISARDVTHALLTGEPKPAYDIAVELADLPDRVELKIEERGIAAGEELATDDYAANKRTVGEATPVAVAELGIDPSLLAKMNWLSLDAVEAYDVMPVICDGQAVAYAVDLMPFNDKIHQLSQKVIGNKEMATGTINRLGVSLVHYARGGRLPHVVGSPKVPLLYTKNIGGNSRLTRAYFTPLGNYPADNVPMVGIIAMVAGKSAQSEALSTLTGRSRNFHRSNLG